MPDVAIESLRPARLPPVRLLVEDLSVERGGRQVLEGVSFSLAPGEALLLTGPNGVGKSTLIRTIFGLVPARGGRISVEDGRPDQPEAVSARCHYLGHRDSLKTALSVSENLAFWRDFLGSDGAGGTDVAAALRAVDLEDLADLPAAYLSAGQRRRLAIARLVCVARPVWLLDEPTAALDAASERRLLALMAAHLEAGGSILAATHLALDLAGTRSLRLSAERQEAA